MDSPILYRSILHLNPDNDPRRDRPQHAWIENPYRVHQRIMWALDGTLPERDKDTGHRPGRDEESPLPLFRIFPESGRVLVQTATRPDWKKAFSNSQHEARFLLDPNCDPDVIEYAPDITEGTTYPFQLLANPSQKMIVPMPEGGWKAARLRLSKEELKLLRKQRKRIGVLKPQDIDEAKNIDEKLRVSWLANRREERLLEWIQRHFEDSGFMPLPVATPGKSDSHGQERVAKVGIRVRDTFTVRAFKGHKSDNRPPEHKKPIDLHAAVFEGVLRVTNPECALKTIRHGIGPAKGLGFGLLLLGNQLEL